MSKTHHLFFQRDEDRKRGPRVAERQRQFELRLARSFAHMRARKQPA